MNKHDFISSHVKPRWITLAGLSICGVFALFLVFTAGHSSLGTLLATKAQAGDMNPPAKSTPRPIAKAEDENSTGPQTIFPKDRLESIAGSLKRKQHELEARETEVRKAEQHLEDLRKETAQNLARMDQVLEEMKKVAGQADDQKQKEIKRWVDIYQAMPPEKASQVIQGLEPEFAMNILAKMDAKKAGKILASVSPDKAIELGKKIGKKLP